MKDAIMSDLDAMLGWGCASWCEVESGGGESAGKRPPRLRGVSEPLGPTKSSLRPWNQPVTPVQPPPQCLGSRPQPSASCSPQSTAEATRKGSRLLVLLLI